MLNKTEDASKCWVDANRPIIADRFILNLARAINGLLVEPIAVLPVNDGDVVRPFKIGIGPELKERLKPDTAALELGNALRRYTRCAAYLLASAQSDSIRYDINGDAVEPVSEKDRYNARQGYAALRLRMKRRKAKPE